jgi:hypothetical protein
VSGERFQRGAKVLVNGEVVETALKSEGAELALLAVLPDRLFSRAALLDLHVLNADGNLSNSVSLAVENGPLITRLSHNRLKAGRGAIEITVDGVAFTKGAVLFINDTPSPTNVLRDNSIRAVIEPRLTDIPGNLVLQVRSTDGGRSNRATIRVVAGD